MFSAELDRDGRGAVGVDAGGLKWRRTVAYDPRHSVGRLQKKGKLHFLPNLWLAEAKFGRVLEEGEG